MSAVLRVTDESARGEKIHSLMLNLPQSQMNLRDLICQRVTQEVNKFNLQRPVVFKCLVQPAAAEETAQGFRLPVHKDQDPVVQCEKAIAAFEDKRFFVMVNGRDVTDLDAQITLNDESSVVFLKLMPVRGE